MSFTAQRRQRGKRAGQIRIEGPGESTQRGKEAENEFVRTS